MNPKDFQTIRHALSHIEYALPGLSDAHEALTRIDRQAKTLADWAVPRECADTDWRNGYEAARAWVCMQLRGGAVQLGIPCGSRDLENREAQLDAVAFDETGEPYVVPARQAQPLGSNWGGVGGASKSFMEPPAQQPNEWREAVLDKLAEHCIDAPIGEPPASILGRIIEVAVQMATDPRINAPEHQAQPEISEAPVAAASDAPPKASWEDSRTQKVYEVLVNDNYPPRGSAEHWEGWKARLVVDALFPEQAQPTDEGAAVKPMTAHRAIYFMERFKKEEKLLGPNEQAAVTFVIAMLEAQQAQPTESLESLLSTAIGILMGYSESSRRNYYKPNSAIDNFVSDCVERLKDWPFSADSPKQSQAEAVPEWLTYDPATDVLTIHGKRYSAGMFGEEGFLAPVGTLLRVEDGGPGVVMLTRVQEAEAVPDRVQIAHVLIPYLESYETMARMANEKDDDVRAYCYHCMAADIRQNMIPAIYKAVGAPKQAEAVPQGYALVSIDALKAWGKYDEIQAACQYLVAQPPICPTCDDVGFCVKPSECAKEIERMQGGDL